MNLTIHINNRLITPVATPASQAPEVNSFSALPEPVLDAILNFEENLFNRRDEPLLSETQEDLRLRRNRYA